MRKEGDRVWQGGTYSCSSPRCRFAGLGLACRADLFLSGDYRFVRFVDESAKFYTHRVYQILSSMCFLLILTSITVYCCL